MNLSNRVPAAARWALLAALGLLGASACDGGHEGDRCNPDLSHDECNQGLSCQQPATCAENYCCPDPAAASNNPFCNGAGCPAVDAGPTPVGDAGASDAGEGG